MNPSELLHNTQQFIKAEFAGEGTGHDYFHIERVVSIARKIAIEENANLLLVELSAWLHDVGDYKLHDGIDRSESLISTFLNSQKASKELIQNVLEIVSQVSFSKGLKPESLEAKIVQDADRLDAIGAIGIARAFTYGGSRNREIWNPKNPELTSIQHFYDKLLKVKDLINTNYAKNLAEERHLFMQEFLEKFYLEWEFKFKI